MVVGNADEGKLRMHVCQKWTDVLKSENRKGEIGGSGFGTFPCGSCSIPVHVRSDMKARDGFGKTDEKVFG